MYDARRFCRPRATALLLSVAAVAASCRCYVSSLLTAVSGQCAVVAVYGGRLYGMLFPVTASDENRPSLCQRESDADYLTFLC